MASKLNALKNSEPDTVDESVHVLASAGVVVNARARKTEKDVSFMVKCRWIFTPFPSAI